MVRCQVYLVTIIPVAAERRRPDAKSSRGCTDHQHHGQLCSTHLPVRLPLALAPLLPPRPNAPQLDDDEHIEDEDEGEGPEEAKDEDIEGEGGLAVDHLALGVAEQPDHIAAVAEMPVRAGTPGQVVRWSGGLVVRCRRIR